MSDKMRFNDETVENLKNVIQGMSRAERTAADTNSTITASIISLEDSEQHVYKCKYQDSIFNAIDIANKDYNKGDAVEVLISNKDSDRLRWILGLADRFKESEEKFEYINQKTFSNNTDSYSLSSYAYEDYEPNPFVTKVLFERDILDLENQPITSVPTVNLLNLEYDEFDSSLWDQNQDEHILKLNYSFETSVAQNLQNLPDSEYYLSFMWRAIVVDKNDSSNYEEIIILKDISSNELLGDPFNYSFPMPQDSVITFTNNWYDWEPQGWHFIMPQDGVVLVPPQLFAIELRQNESFNERREQSEIEADVSLQDIILSNIEISVAEKVPYSDKYELSINDYFQAILTHNGLVVDNRFIDFQWYRINPFYYYGSDDAHIVDEKAGEGWEPLMGQTTAKLDSSYYNNGNPQCYMCIATYKNQNIKSQKAIKGDFEDDINLSIWHDYFDWTDESYYYDETSEEWYSRSSVNQYGDWINYPNIANAKIINGNDTNSNLFEARIVLNDNQYVSVSAPTIDSYPSYFESSTDSIDTFTALMWYDEDDTSDIHILFESDKFWRPELWRPSDIHYCVYTETFSMLKPHINRIYYFIQLNDFGVPICAYQHTVNSDIVTFLPYVENPHSIIKYSANGKSPFALQNDGNKLSPSPLVIKNLPLAQRKDFQIFLLIPTSSEYFIKSPYEYIQTYTYKSKEYTQYLFEDGSFIIEDWYDAQKYLKYDNQFYVLIQEEQKDDVLLPVFFNITKENNIFSIENGNENNYTLTLIPTSNRNIDFIYTRVGTSDVWTTSDTLSLRAVLIDHSDGWTREIDITSNPGLEFRLYTGTTSASATIEQDENNQNVFYGLNCNFYNSGISSFTAWNGGVIVATYKQPYQLYTLRAYFVPNACFNVNCNATVLQNIINNNLLVSQRYNLLLHYKNNGCLVEDLQLPKVHINKLDSNDVSGWFADYIYLRRDGALTSSLASVLPVESDYNQSNGCDICLIANSSYRNNSLIGEGANTGVLLDFNINRGQTAQDVVCFLYFPVYPLLDVAQAPWIEGWDGISTQVNQNNYILSPQGGFGSKDINNLFTGLVLGSVTDNTYNIGHLRHGLFGYSHGLESLFLDAETGEATFGIEAYGQLKIKLADPTNPSSANNYMNLHLVNAHSKIWSGTHDTLNAATDGFYLSHDGLSIGNHLKLFYLTGQQSNPQKTEGSYIELSGGQIGGFVFDVDTLYTGSLYENTGSGIAINGKLQSQYGGIRCQHNGVIDWHLKPDGSIITRNLTATENGRIAAFNIIQDTITGVSTNPAQNVVVDILQLQIGDTWQSGSGINRLEYKQVLEIRNNDKEYYLSDTGNYTVNAGFAIRFYARNPNLANPVWIPLKDSEVFSFATNGETVINGYLADIYNSQRDLSKFALTTSSFKALRQDDNTAYAVFAPMVNDNIAKHFSVSGLNVGANSIRLATALDTNYQATEETDMYADGVGGIIDNLINSGGTVPLIARCQAIVAPQNNPALGTSITYNNLVLWADNVRCRENLHIPTSLTLGTFGPDYQWGNTPHCGTYGLFFNYVNPAVAGMIGMRVQINNPLQYITVHGLTGYVSTGDSGDEITSYNAMQIITDVYYKNNVLHKSYRKVQWVNGIITYVSDLQESQV